MNTKRAYVVCKEKYFYHVISDVPKHKEKHILMDAEHPNRVHMRVYKRIDTVKDIFSNP